MGQDRTWEAGGGRLDRHGLRADNAILDGKERDKKEGPTTMACAVRYIYKICTQEEWDEAVATGQFTGAPIDLADGFIHFSTSDQVAETLERHFAGQEGLLLLTVPIAPLGDSLAWEASRGGDLFPHLYDTLPVAAIEAVNRITLGPDGRHELPDSLDRALPEAGA